MVWQGNSAADGEGKLTHRRRDLPHKTRARRRKQSCRALVPKSELQAECFSEATLEQKALWEWH